MIELEATELGGHRDNAGGPVTSTERPGPAGPQSESGSESDSERAQYHSIRVRANHRSTSENSVTHHVSVT